MTRVWHPLACKEPPWQPQLDALKRRRAEEKWQMVQPKARVLELFGIHPDWSSSQIAKELNLTSGYVRKTLTRNGRRLARHKIYYP